MTIRVLVAEDEALIADDVRRTLGKLGYDVPKPAMTADEAIAAARELRPDLVLMDIRLHPPGDGIDAALEIRRRLGIPVVFLTAHSDEATLARAKTAEPYGYLLKPFEDRELRTTIELALHKHRLDARLAEQQRWFSTTLESLGDAVIATDPGGTISFLNPMAERLTNWKREDAIGRPIEEVFEVVGADGAPIESPIRTAMRSSVAVPMPEGATMKVKGGRVVTIDDSAAPIVDDSGHLLGGVVIFRDVTEKRKLEQRLALAERLALIGTLAAGVAHEINNPLAVLMGQLELVQRALARTCDDPRPDCAAPHVAEPLRAARDAAARVRQIVADLKLFSRADEAHRGPVDVVEVLESAVRMANNEIRHRARLVSELRPVPPVTANPFRLGQVFVNLLVNAAQAIPEGHSD
ncbi:MAG TPA: response regulator, partial [Myxococcota bacterium]|nr:response regulator [Myxococcota bacterium]